MVNVVECADKTCFCRLGHIITCPYMSTFSCILSYSYYISSCTFDQRVGGLISDQMVLTVDDTDIDNGRNTIFGSIFISHNT